MTPDTVREVLCGTRVVPVQIRRGRRKSLALHVFADRPVELRAPLKCPWREIDAFLDSRREWIAESLESLSAHDLPTAPRYVEGETHYFLGSPLRLKLMAGKTRRVSVVGQTFSIRSSHPNDPKKVREAIDDFYRREAKRLLPARVDICQQKFKDLSPPAEVSVRKMRARWGHCSREGEICLNTLLMQKPLPAIDFVVTHELCHLRHFAHNKSFYRLMDRVMPDWREREKLLVTNNVRLQLELF